MFLIDDLLLSPVHALFWVFKEIANSVQQEITNEAQEITLSLSELYMRLETGEITEEEFDAREKELLDRLDEIKNREK